MLPPEPSVTERDGHITVKQLVDAQINRRVYTSESQINMSAVALILILKKERRFIDLKVSIIS